MFEKYYTTKMSPAGRQLKTRFKKISSKNTRLSLLFAGLCTVILTAVLLSAHTFITAKNADDGPYLMNYQKYLRFYNYMVGSTMADLLYADNERVVFHYADGLFVYSISEKRMERAIDMSMLNCTSNMQGSNVLNVSVSNDGKKALLHNMGIKSEIENYDNYIVNLDTGRAKITAKQKLKNQFSNFSETYYTVPDAKGWTSDKCVKTDNRCIYLTCEEWSIGSIKLCIINSDGTTDETYVFGEKDKIFDNMAKDNPNNVVSAFVNLWSNADYAKMKQYCTDSFIGSYFRFTDDEKTSFIANVADICYLSPVSVESAEYKNKEKIQIEITAFVVRPMHSSSSGGDTAFRLELSRQPNGEWLIDGIRTRPF